jgi:hypothetical protein
MSADEDRMSAFAFQAALAKAQDALQDALRELEELEHEGDFLSKSLIFGLVEAQGLVRHVYLSAVERIAEREATAA